MTVSHTYVFVFAVSLSGIDDAADESLALPRSELKGIQNWNSDVRHR